MACEPTTAASRKQLFSDVFSGDFHPPPGSVGVSPSAVFSTDKSRQFDAMINEIERVRSRFEAEKSHSDQFSQQMGMLAQQIGGLSKQQTSMLGFHIGRMDMMLTELKNSKDSVTKEQQRAAFEAEQRLKFENEQRERLERERAAEHERREFREKLEREQRNKDEREQQERDRREKMESLQKTCTDPMNLSDIIPRPSRTVSASKRKLSLDIPSSTALAPASSGPSSSSESSTKRAKTSNEGGSSGGDLSTMFQRFMQEKSSDSAGATADDNAMSDDEVIPSDAGASSTRGTSASSVSSSNNAAAAPQAVDNELPADIHEQLKAQAMQMLQAQLAAGNSMADSPPPTTDADLPPLDQAHAPAPASSGSVVKSEPAAAVPADVAAPLAAVKAEPSSGTKYSAKKSKKAKKAVTPAVEDTTIADPMSVPLKNKAIHEWMCKDPERLYTADDICKAGIRYRASQTNASRQIQRNSIYIVEDIRDASKCLREVRNKRFWSRAQTSRVGGWKVTL